MKRHLKTYPAPRFWPIRIKEREFTVRPSPGPHPVNYSIPLGIVLRDVLNYATTIGEAKKILSERKVMVDGKVRTDYKYPLGLMDVLYLRPSNEYYRVLPHPVKKLSLVKISPEEATFKLVRVAGKRILKGGRVQLNFHDGRTYSIKVDDPFNIQVGYKIYDAVKLTIPDGEIADHIPLEPGTFVCVIGGSNIGKYGEVVELPATRSKDQLVKVRIEGVESTVTLKYLFPIGKGSPIINISGEVA
ncbi:MAG: 30S ribosomal protein S4e [Candidatus Methanomethyliales bacterium]|nr:30S ribosomal protein S4e [Candidatus Methanomethylicales archaeon]